MLQSGKGHLFRIKLYFRIAVPKAFGTAIQVVDGCPMTSDISFVLSQFSLIFDAEIQMRLITLSPISDFQF